MGTVRFGTSRRGAPSVTLHGRVSLGRAAPGGSEPPGEARSRPDISSEHSTHFSYSETHSKKKKKLNKQDLPRGLNERAQGTEPSRSRRTTPGAGIAPSPCNPAPSRAARPRLPSQSVRPDTAPSRPACRATLGGRSAMSGGPGPPRSPFAGRGCLAALLPRWLPGDRGYTAAAGPPVSHRPRDPPLPCPPLPGRGLPAAKPPVSEEPAPPRGLGPLHLRRLCLGFPLLLPRTAPARPGPAQSSPASGSAADERSARLIPRKRRQSREGSARPGQGAVGGAGAARPPLPTGSGRLPSRPGWPKPTRNPGPIASRAGSQPPGLIHPAGDFTAPVGHGAPREAADPVWRSWESWPWGCQ